MIVQSLVEFDDCYKDGVASSLLVMQRELYVLALFVIVVCAELFVLLLAQQELVLVPVLLVQQRYELFALQDVERLDDDDHPGRQGHRQQQDGHGAGDDVTLCPEIDETELRIH